MNTPEHIKQGISRKEYCKIHTWIRNNKGKAYKCENEKCQGKSNLFQNALRKGFKYEKNIDNFIMLCVICHREYDFVDGKHDKLINAPWTEERRNKLRLSRLGKKASEESRKKMSISRTGDKNNMYGVSISGKDHHFYGKRHTNETKEKIRLFHSKWNKEDIQEIKRLYNIGVKQSEIAKKFKASRPFINNVVHGKRYSTW